MDKSTFIQRAPIYSGLAIASYFRTTGETSASETMIRNHYFVRDPEDPEPDAGDDRAGNYVLLERGALYLEREGLVQVSLDEFGPPIFQVLKDFKSGWDKLTSDHRIPFFKYQQLGDQAATAWLHEALQSVNEQYKRLGIQPSDFESGDNEWEPIPLDRDDAGLAKAQVALDETIEGLRIDNGYAASSPEERDFIVNELSEGAKKLKTDKTVSRAFIKLKIIDPLGRIMLRFGKASLGMLAEAAKQAFLEWLRKKGINFLDHY